jgi:peptidoglycan/LPS O-acetylase OafA/YrhL
LLLRERARTGAVDLKAFYVRRILKIWPLYFFFIAIAALLAAFRVTNQHLTVAAVLSFVLLAGNWFVVFSGYPRSVILPLWSVSVEEQFYLTWAPVAKRLSRTALTRVAIGLLVIASVARALVLTRGISDAGLWCMTFTRMDPIAAGILIAVLLERFQSSYIPKL